MRQEEVFELCDTVREASFDLHRYLRHGHLEKVYENGLAHRLDKLGYSVRQQVPIRVREVDEFVLGDFVADLVVENTLVVEIKSCQGLVPEHVAQILGYLKASDFEHGLLINFGAPELEIKKYADLKQRQS